MSTTTSRWRLVADRIRAMLVSMTVETERASDAHPPDMRCSQGFTTWMR
ncbi:MULTISPECIES: hypothetical protein [unclassified Plantibacter]|jgi:hypothetical protein